MKGTHVFFDKLNDIIENICGLLIFILSIALFFGVTSRYTFQLIVPELQIIQKFAVCWIVFLGSASAIYRNKHLTIDIVDEYLSPKTLRIKAYIIHVLLIASIVLLIFIGQVAFINGLARKEAVPIWFLEGAISRVYFHTSMIVGAVLMLVFEIYLFLKLIITDLKRKNPSTGEYPS
jgi:TRAP-type C4-dicarboxylate transport system permease small subunit